MRRRKAQQFSDSLLVGVIFSRAFFALPLLRIFRPLPVIFSVIFLTPALPTKYCFAARTVPLAKLFLPTLTFFVVSSFAVPPQVPVQRIVAKTVLAE